MHSLKIRKSYFDNFCYFRFCEKSTRSEILVKILGIILELRILANLKEKVVMKKGRKVHPKETYSSLKLT